MTTPANKLAGVAMSLRRTGQLKMNLGVLSAAMNIAFRAVANQPTVAGKHSNSVTSSGL